MSKATTGEAEVLRLRQSIEMQMRRRILEAIELVLEEELTEALGTGRYERGRARRGYRNGHQTRRITMAVGTQKLDVPRGRIVDADGSSREFRSEALPRYARRTREVDEAILGAYLAGATSHRSATRSSSSMASTSRSGWRGGWCRCRCSRCWGWPRTAASAWSR